ncbi:MULTISPECIES: serine/threonine protein kinase [Metallosphaera]|uniref:serine/threonine protein kinase n=1 Tax=Metallosphaera TaxID=41980 RepID=UPI001EE06562|nr:serine/threonine protein kinase [Metallosphaera javensis (ex Hofmann et al. 2022)]
MVEIGKFVFPSYSPEIEEELVSSGITRAYSFGGTTLGRYRVLGKGKTGVVVLTEDGLALKIRRTDSPKESLELEARLQMRAEKSAPRVVKFGRNFILMEYVRGRHLDYVESRDVMVDLLMRAWYLERVNLEHRELVHPWKNVIVTESRTYILDYDSVSVKERAFNVNKILNAFGLHELARAYKKGEIELDEVLKRI